MTNRGSTPVGNDDTRRANPLGAYVTALGAAITVISVWLSWLTLGPGESEANVSSGYEADSVVPFIAYLAVGFAVALLYATRRADRRQHRGLSLAAMAVGLASLLWVLSFFIDPISTVQYDEDVTTEFGVIVALIGTLLWTVGSFLLAKEPEGDIEPARTVVANVQPVHETVPAHTATTTTGTTSTDYNYDGILDTDRTDTGRDFDTTTHRH